MVKLPDKKSVKKKPARKAPPKRVAKVSKKPAARKSPKKSPAFVPAARVIIPVGHVDFGKHRGTPWAEVPEAYLLWMIDNAHKQSDVARAEIKRRQAPLARPRPVVSVPIIVIGNAIIDTASVELHEEFDETRNIGEGIVSWLLRSAREAFRQGGQGDAPDEAIGLYNHVLFDFVGTTVTRVRARQTAGKPAIFWPAPMRRKLEREATSNMAYGIERRGRR